jgi:hypothetical protein
MLHTIVCSEPFVWLFSPVCVAVIPTLDVGFIYLLLGNDPINSGALGCPNTDHLPLCLWVSKQMCMGYISSNFPVFLENWVCPPDFVTYQTV